MNKLNRYKHHKCIELDAGLVLAALEKHWEVAVMNLGMTLDHAMDRAMWLKAQDEAYIKDVADTVVVFEQHIRKVDTKAVLVFLTQEIAYWEKQHA